MPNKALNGGITKNNLNQARVHLSDVVVSDAFLQNQGLNNEVPFHICPFHPSLQNEMNQLVRQLINCLSEAGKNVLEINLYDLVVDILKREDDWKWLLENEASTSRAELQEELQGVLDVESVITPEMVRRMDSAAFDVLLVTGIGEIFPYIRSHNILNNLQKCAKQKPTLMFFPGQYKHSLDEGAKLVLFNQLPDGYYRAFNILDRAI